MDNSAIAAATGAKRPQAERAKAHDALSEQLRQLYNSIADEPLPENLLDLVRQLKD